MKLERGLGLTGLTIGMAVLLTGCDEVSSAADKVSVCTEALGLANLNPTVDPDKLADEAREKADRLRELAGQVADQDLKENLFTLADSYVALEKRRVEHLSDLNDWIQRNTDNFERLRSACL